MENYALKIAVDKDIHCFEVAEYPHAGNESCKYKIYQQGTFVASFEPDRQNILHICQNPAQLDEELLYLLADQIEAMHPRQIPTEELNTIEFDRDDEMEAPPQDAHTPQ